MSEAMRRDEDVFIMGEDIAEMGGSMGVTQGMLEEFGPERVRNTPISEMAIVGAGVGAAVAGMRPIVEVMYQDFLTLAMEQLVAGREASLHVGRPDQGAADGAHAGRRRLVAGRTARAAARGWFVHVPGLKVVFASTPEDVRGLLWTSIYEDNPVVFFEHRTLYGIKGDVPDEIEGIELGKARVHRGGRRDRRRDRPARARSARCGQGGRGGGDLGRGRRSADPSAARRGRSSSRCRRRTAASSRTRRSSAWASGQRWRRSCRSRLSTTSTRRCSASARSSRRFLRSRDGAVRRAAPGGRARRDQAHRGALLMSSQVTLPRLGQGMESGTIVKWLKSEGEKVEKGEPLYELDTEKVTQEVEADVGGVVLKILAQEGQEIEVGKAVAVIGEEGEKVAEPEPDEEPTKIKEPAAEAEEPTKVTEEEPQEEGEPAPAGGTSVNAGGRQVPSPKEPQQQDGAATVDGGRVKASPLARRIAKERASTSRRCEGPAPKAASSPRTSSARAARHRRAAAGAPTEVEVVELTRMRQTIARRLTEAWQAPHFQIAMSADMRAAIRLRETLVARTKEGGVKPTYSDILTKVCALALMRHRAINAHFADGKVHQFPTANIGIAVAVPDGLIVPVIPNCEARTISQIAEARKDIVDRARGGKLQTSDLVNGTFDLQPRDVRRREVHRRAQPAAGDDPGGGRHRGARRRRGRRGRRAAPHGAHALV